MYSILKKEITTYLSSLVAYVTIGVFLLVLGLFLWVFPDSSILDYGYAALDSLFGTAPYLFMFLIPAITMRSLAEERKEGTFELLLTRPLTDLQIILGKYLAAVILVLFALLPTLTYYYSVYTLGSPQGNIDSGAVIGSYIGLFLLGAGFAAIGLFASAITKNQIIAFTIAVFLCFFFYSGFDSLSGLLSLQNTGIQGLGINDHYQSISRGVLDTRDLAYFIILIAVFIWLTLFALLKQQQKKPNNNITIGAAGIVLVLAVFTNFAFTRIDFTREGRYTISKVSRGILDSLPAPVKVTVYLQGDLTGGMKRLQRATADMLADLQAYSHRKLQFEFVDPLKKVDAGQQEQAINELQARGIEPTALSVKTDDGVTQKTIFPAAMVTANGKDIPVKLLYQQTQMGLSADEVLNNSIQNLEYAFTSAIKKVSRGGKPQIGFTTGHDELNDIQLNDAMKSLSDGYEVGRVDLKSIPFDSLMKVRLMVVPKPEKPFTEPEKFKLDQYLMRGGKILWTIDQVNAELDSLRGHGDQLAFPKQLNLDDQLFVYGIRINYDLIADISAAQIPVSTGNVGGQPQIQMVPWLFYPIFMPLAKHPIVRNLDGIRGEFVSTIDLLDIRDVQKTVLLASSPYNHKITAPHLLSLQAIEQEPDPKQFQSVPKITAVLLEGKFQSDFKNRPVPAGLGENIIQQSASRPTKMIVISDGDVFKNQVGADGSPYPLGYDRYTRQSYGNKNLLLNIADYMTDDSGLIALRNKEIKLRLLSRARVRNEKLYWQVINTTIPLFLVLIFAIFQHYMRKRKYAH
ncbi:gliding motility-associated ABC transporter substrate-binding protein GldG [Mucilaginibacter sp. UR6-11]|uniref:gliding motility-associated ABC transporter substrate-binding protein GldG n=1 Tax=Mucilaginibacter sp. UR6-11 TaxID=1435644 RepID=UPI001E60677B|nr:gliding motility-associated ABC transporter substrate-binding protein GldG [Mucilaginibacter sp. UR6-11]